MLAGMKIQAGWVVVLMAVCVAGWSAQAQQGAAGRLKAGAWQVRSLVTPSMGSPVNSTVHVCATKASDFWTRSRPGMSCDAPTVTENGSSVHVELRCKGSAGPVTWTAQTLVDETFNAQGSGFHATGKTTTTTVMPGGNPMTATATMVAGGTYDGACGAR